MSKSVKKETKETEVKKIVPSKLENAFYPIVYNTFGKMIPKNMTPNQMTLIGALGGLFGIICAFLAKFNTLFLIGTIIGLLTHIICDDLDGYIARKRNMSSTAGAFFDFQEQSLFHDRMMLHRISFFYSQPQSQDKTFCRNSCSRNSSKADRNLS